MRKLLLTIAAFIALSILYAPSSFAQCDDDDFLDECAAGLKDYKFLKAYKINISNTKKGDSGPKIEYSYVFSKGSNYKLTVCNTESGTMVAHLYDRSRKLVASSYDKRTKKHYPALGYQCTASGVYYIVFELPKGEDACGVSVLGFKK